MATDTIEKQSIEDGLALALTGIAQIRDILKDKQAVQSDEVKAHMMNVLPKVIKPIVKAVESIHIPEVKIPPQKEIKIPEYPKFPDIPEPKDEVVVKNLSQLGTYFEDLENTIRTHFNVDIPTPKVTVNPPDINVEAPIVNVDPVDLTAVIKALKPLQFITDKAGKPISVRLSDGKNFLKAVKKITDSNEKVVQAFSQSPGMNKKEYLAAERALNQKATATNTKVTVGNTSTAVRPANTGRISLTLVNDSNQTIYISKSGTAVMNEGIRLNSGGGSVSIDDYTGAVAAICADGSKNLTVCEV